MSDTLVAKEAKLLQYIQQYKHPAVAFSGGVDSSVVLAACKAAGVQVQPIMALAAMIPQFERQDAVKVAQETSSELITLTVNPLGNPQFCANDSKRCYYCKTMIMTAVKQQAQDLGCDAIFDGTNADDTGDYRPGMQAIKDELEDLCLKYLEPEKYDLVVSLMKNKQRSLLKSLDSLKLSFL